MSNKKKLFLILVSSLIANGCGSGEAKRQAVVDHLLTGGTVACKDKTDNKEIYYLNPDNSYATSSNNILILKPNRQFDTDWCVKILNPNKDKEI